MPLTPAFAAKAALIRQVRRQGTTEEELARRMGIRDWEAVDILRPNMASPMSRLTLSNLGDNARSPTYIFTETRVGTGWPGPETLPNTHCLPESPHFSRPHGPGPAKGKSASSGGNYFPLRTKNVGQVP